MKSIWTALAILFALTSLHAQWLNYPTPGVPKLNHFIVLDTDLVEYHCLENEKDVPRLIGK